MRFQRLKKPLPKAALNTRHFFWPYIQLPWVFGSSSEPTASVADASLLLDVHFRIWNMEKLPIFVYKTIVWRYVRLSAQEIYMMNTNKTKFMELWYSLVVLYYCVVFLIYFIEQCFTLIGSYNGGQPTYSTPPRMLSSTLEYNQYWVYMLVPLTDNCPTWEN